MIYLYDDAIVEDLRRSFNPDEVANPHVKVADPEMCLQLVAQMLEDKIEYPVVAVQRENNYKVDTERWNFTRVHKGVPVVMDTDTNEIYYERAMPIKLSYTITLLATNQADMDELERELIFKYSSMYFLTIRLPYESRRRIRFGITIDDSRDIERSSNQVNYNKAGQLYQTILPMRCEGCVLVNNVPQKLKRTECQVDPNLK